MLVNDWIASMILPRWKMEFDLATGESRLFENTLNVAPTTILNDGTILAATPMGVCQ